MRKRFWFGIGAFCFCFLQGGMTEKSCKEILEESLAEIDKIKTLKFQLKVAERFNGKLLLSESKIKLMRSPLKIYINLSGAEVLWAENEHKGLALANPGGFPFINLYLNPMGSLMRENQHHTVFQVGYDYFADIIRHTIKTAGAQYETYFRCSGIVEWNTRECYRMTADYTNFFYTEYSVGKGETLVSIAAKLKVSDYMLMEINKRKDYYDVSEKQKILVPNVYARKLILYIDKKLKLPLVIKVYDDKGLFEAYEYHNLQVNLKIAEEEFTKDYKEYGF